MADADDAKKKAMAEIDTRRAPYRLYLRYTAMHYKKTGQKWCLMDSKWLDAFKKHSWDGQGNPPGPVDNTRLLDGGTVRSDARSNSKQVPRQCWDALVKQYGSHTAAIEGSVTNTGSNDYPQFKIETFVLTGKKGNTVEPPKARSATEVPKDLAKSIPQRHEFPENKPESDIKGKDMRLDV
ncbi:hypothetical protein BGZ82_002641 [Podila clonocystis]|nr:hypothetical protein BGZ82_002641 [Podila clonocystis]